MGFFGSKKTYVASSVYNLMGDVTMRPSYLKTTIVGNVIANNGTSMGNAISSAYINGPGMRLRSFFRWCERNYAAIGVPTGNLGSTMNVDGAVIEDEIPNDTALRVSVQRVNAGSFDYSYWAEQYMFENHPTLISSLWSSDITEAGEITITFEDLTTVSFTPVIDRNAVYIYAVYSLVDDATMSWGNAKLYIYKVGSGNAVLDALVYDELDDGEYVPFIPLRLNNQFLSPTYNSAAYQLAKRAYKKGVGGKLDDLIDKVKENDAIDEIDYAYVMFGVPLNTKTRNGKEYLYRFFDKCRQSQTANNAEYLLSQQANAAYEASILAWNQWKAAQTPPPVTDPPTEPHPLYGTPEPERLYQPGTPGSEVVIKTNGTLNTNVDIKISWGAISQTTGTGLKKPDAKPKDLWITMGAEVSGSASTIYSNGTFLGVNNSNNAVINIHWQVSADEWKTLSITGLRHENTIYKTKDVDTTAAEAMADLEESGFLVPLHMQTVKEMRLVDSTQMMTSAAYIVFNSKKTVKQKWYQTWAFKVFLFIAIVALTIIFPPLGAGAGALGTAAGVGAAVGLTGLAAIIAGTIINALAAMIISKIIMMAAVELLGEKWGAIIGAIVSVVALDVASAASSGASLSQIGSTLASASNLMQLTMAVGNGVAGYIRGETMETMQKNAEMMKDYEKQKAEMADQFANEFGYDRAMINPLMLTDTLSGSYVETEAEFLTRTLLTGSDIAEMSINLVTGFAENTLKLDLRP